MKFLSFRKRICSLLMIAAVFSICLFVSQMQVSAAAKQRTVSTEELNSGLQFTFVDMPYDGAYSPVKYHNGQKLRFSAIQNYDFTPDGKYIFTSSKCMTGSAMHTLITRCIVPAGTGAEAKAQCVDTLILDKYGHGEVLAVTQDDTGNEVYNLWVGCDPEKTQHHATAIARLTYRVDENGKGSVTKVVKIKGFKKANVKKGKAAYFKGKKTPLWVIAATDTKSNQIVFRLRFKDGQGCTFLSYDFKKLNAALNKVANNGTYDIKKAAKWQMARVNYSGQMQSFDVDGKTLYMADGQLGGRAVIRVLPYKTQKNKKLSDQKKTDKNLKKIIRLTPLIYVNGITFNKSELELEGLKVKDGTGMLYINFFQKGKILRENLALYQIAQ